MRVVHIDIRRWRSFSDVVIDFAKESPIVCLVGANGSGKSQILELVAACSQQIGLTNGFASNRPSPLSEEGSFSLSYRIEENVIPEIEDASQYPDQAFSNWDRTITISYSKQDGISFTVGSLDGPIKILRRS